MVGTEKERITEEKARLHLEKLEEKLNYYKQVVINSSNAIIVQDFNGIIKAWNKGAEKIYGFTEGEMLGKNIIKIISKEYQAEARKNIKLIREGKPTFLVNQIRKTKDKKKIFVKITYSPIYEKEEIIEIATTEEDITKLKKSIEELKTSEVQFRELFNNMDEAVAVYDVKNNGKEVIIKDFNRAAEKLEQVKKENVIGKKVDKIFKGVKEFGLYKIFQEVWKTGKPLHHPISFYKDKYHQGWRENFVFKLPHDGIVAIYSDISERKEIERKLKENEEKYRSVSEKANDGIAIIQNGIIVYGNPALAQIRGDSLKNILHHKFLEYVAPEEKEKIKIYYQRRFKGEKVPSKYETILLKKDKRKICAELNAGIIRYKGKPADLVIIRDITERKISEEKKYQTLYQSSADAIMILEPPNWNFTSGNNSAIKVFNAKNEKDFTSRAPWEYSPKYQPDGQLSSEKAKEMIMKAMKEGSKTL
ncbi:PAS domain S-box protein [Candidatus Pacearchaeota archaeon]|jgi:PAS domain S-box-containing protein|nr:PAS domain S-box protein [Candidatus Pacearchaeota archaeon]